MSSVSTESLLSTKELFSSLDEIKGRSKKDRLAKLLPLLIRAADSADRLIALDYSVEKSLLSRDQQAKFLGRIDTKTFNLADSSWTNPIDGSEMLWIPPGSAILGKLGKRKRIGGFFMARYPVTNAQFREFLKQTNYTPPADSHDFEVFSDYWLRKETAKTKLNHPAAYLSFADSLAYCVWACLALPGEFHWEKAARGCDGRKFPWGEHASYRANVHFNKIQATDVTKFDKVRTVYGCTNMIGNVDEWCVLQELDSFEDESMIANLPPQEWSEDELQCVRGGNFLRSTMRTLTTFHRRRLNPIRRNKWVGFRPAFYPFS